ncbi:unannotated protein [freshwater metagenome]|uniref:Unannotated protein n=1 Tax=freshwater metagenome TaxID=449393 RepID=A0A6J7UW69_9ZZZZ
MVDRWLPPQDFFHRCGNERRVLAQKLKLFWMLEQSKQPVRGGSSSGLVPCHDQEDKEQGELQVIKMATVHLGREQVSSEVVFWVQSCTLCHLGGVGKDFCNGFHGCLWGWCNLWVLVIDERVAQLVQSVTISNRHPHKLANRPHGNNGCNIGHEVTGVLLRKLREHSASLGTHRGFDRTNSLRCERSSHHITKVAMLRRVHPDDDHS